VERHSAVKVLMGVEDRFAHVRVYVVDRQLRLQVRYVWPEGAAIFTAVLM